MATPLERKTIRISVSTTTAAFEADLTAAIEAQAAAADGWYIAWGYEIDAKRDKLSAIFIMEKEV